MFNNKLFRVIAVLLLIVAMTANTFAAVVSDNDASALVTKEELEALKKNFDNKIENYVANVENYIDGAIVVYLADYVPKPSEHANLVKY